MTKWALTPPLPEYHSPLILQPKSPSPYFLLSPSVSSLWWTLLLAVVLPVETVSLLALPACQQAALISHHSLPALSPGSGPGSRAISSATIEKPLLSSRIKLVFFNNKLE